MENKKYLKESLISQKVEVRNSRFHVNGLFTKEPIKDECVKLFYKVKS